MRIKNILIGLFIFTNTAFSQSSAAFWLAGGEEQVLPIATNGLIAYYDASNVDSYDPANPGSTWNDLSGNNYHVTNYGATHSTDNDGVFYFDGVDDYMVYEGDINEDVMTFSIWTKGSSITDNCIVDLDNINLTNDLQQELYIYDKGSSDYDFKIVSESTSGNELNNTNTIINDNSWYNVTFTYDGTNYVIYINDVQVSVSTNTSPTIVNGDFFFNGYIGELFFYNRVLTSQELTDNYNATKDRYVEPCDEYYYNTSLLLHMDGSNGSTTFTDNSINNFTVTANGDAQISTTQSVFGGASGKFDGSGDFIEVTNSQEFNMGSGDFTIEGWMYLNTTSGAKQSLICFMDRLGAGFGPEIAFALEYSGNNRFRGYVYSSSTIYQVINTTTVNPNTWYHLAFVRSGNTLNLFVNGISTGTTTISVALNYNTNFTLNNSYFNLFPRFLNGFSDEIRITKGIARYTSNFTPPTAPFQDNACLWDGTQTSLLDDYSGAAAAYSVRALNSAYTGPLMTIRRASDNAEEDIFALANGDLDEDLINYFCSGTTCYVQTWYDQSGNGHNTTAPAANQPTIYTSGAIVVENGKPAILWPNYTTPYYLKNTSFSNSHPLTFFTTLYFNGTSNRQDYIFDSSVSTSSTRTSFLHPSEEDVNKFALYGGKQSAPFYFSETSVDLNAGQKMFSVLFNGSSSYIYKNGSLTTSGASSEIVNTLMIGLTIGNHNSITATFNWSGKIHELIIYDSNQSTNRANIESNINSYYSIY